jgi:hypothetical protein
MPSRRTLIASIMLLGVAIRLAHLPLVDLARPFYRGGLYAEFSQQIAAHGYELPRVIPYYSDGGIPFAYPPLPFYIEAALLDLLRLPEFPVVNLLPALFSVLTLPSFYLFVRELRLDSRTQLVALLVYATLPTAYSQHIGGAGLPEASGSLALIWFALSLARTHNLGSGQSYLLAGLFWALCVVASPGTAYASVPTFFIFAIAQLARADRQTRVRGLLLSGLVAVALSSPYWLTVMLYHGPGVFFESLAAQHDGKLVDVLGRLLSLKAFQFSGTPAPFIWSIAVFCGAVWTVLHRQLLVPVWFVALYMIPREGYWMAAIPAGIMGGIGCTEVLLPPMVNLLDRHQRRPAQVVVTAALALLLGLNIVLTPFVQMARILAPSQRDRLQPSHQELQAMSWVRDNTPTDAKFIVLHDSFVKEWVPHIARRTVLNMAFGSEWEPEEAETIKGFGVLNFCSDFNCVQDSVAQTTGYRQVYLFLQRKRYSSLRAASTGVQTPRVSFKRIWQNSQISVGLLRQRTALLGAMSR